MLFRQRYTMYQLYAMQCGKCCYCNRHCVWENRSGYRGALLPDQATIEHVYSKYDLRRFAIGGNEELMMACNKCNQDRNHRETLHFTKKVDIDSSFKLTTLLT